MFPRVSTFTIFAGYSCHITYEEKVLCLRRTRIKSTKKQNSNARISKHIKLHANLIQAPQLQFLALYFNYHRQAISTIEFQMCLKVLNHCIIQKCFAKVLKMCNIVDEQIENGKLLNKTKIKPNLNLFSSNLV